MCENIYSADGQWSDRHTDKQEIFCASQTNVLDINGVHEKVSNDESRHKVGNYILTHKLKFAIGTRLNEPCTTILSV